MAAAFSLPKALCAAEFSSGVDDRVKFDMFASVPGDVIAPPGFTM
jgi:hypothetical protein